jgi:hypothetical protein
VPTLPPAAAPSPAPVQHPSHFFVPPPHPTPGHHGPQVPGPYYPMFGPSALPPNAGSYTPSGVWQPTPVAPPAPLFVMPSMAASPSPLGARAADTIPPQGRTPTGHAATAATMPQQLAALSLPQQLEEMRHQMTLLQDNALTIGSRSSAEATLASTFANLRQYALACGVTLSNDMLRDLLTYARNAARQAQQAGRPAEDITRLDALVNYLQNVQAEQGVILMRGGAELAQYPPGAVPEYIQRLLAKIDSSFDSAPDDLVEAANSAYYKRAKHTAHQSPAGRTFFQPGAGPFGPLGGPNMASQQAFSHMPQYQPQGNPQQWPAPQGSQQWGNMPQGSQINPMQYLDDTQSQGTPPLCSRCHGAGHSAKHCQAPYPLLRNGQENLLWNPNVIHLMFKSDLARKQKREKEAGKDPKKDKP